jgi:hypothetical protein
MKRSAAIETLVRCVAVGLTVLLCLPLRAEAPQQDDAAGKGNDARVVENPIYNNWRRFPVGSKVTYRSVTEADGAETVQELVYRLKDKTDDRVVIGRQVIFILPGGQRREIPEMTSENARTYRLGEDAKRPDPENPPGLLEKGEEELEILGKKIETEWFYSKMRVEAGDMLTRSWSSKAVPGGLVKSVSETPATNSVHRIELIGMEIPEQD